MRIVDYHLSTCTWPLWLKPGGERMKYHDDVNALWPQKLWKRHKLDHDVWETYTLLCREGLQARQNNLKRVREAEEMRDAAAERDEVVKRFQSDPSKVLPFKTFPVGARSCCKSACAIQFWLSLESPRKEKHNWRNPCFLAHCSSTLVV